MSVQTVKSLLVVAGLLLIFSMGCATAHKPAVPDVAAEQAAKVLAEAAPYPTTSFQPEAEQVLKRAGKEPAFRKSIIDALSNRLLAYKEPYQGAREIVALRRLKATEAIPTLKRRWAQTPKETHSWPYADPRVQLATTLAVLLPLDARVEFLVNTIEDEAEAPEVRLFAEVSAAADGDRSLIKYLADRYHKRCKQVPRTLFSPRYTFNPKKETWDQDGDGLSDYLEQGLVLDPKNPDTDGDGIPDGDDRNPLTAPSKTPPTEMQQAAMVLAYYYDRYLYHPHVDPGVEIPRLPGYSDLVLFVSTTHQAWDNSDDPSLLAGIELVGVNRIVLPGGRAGKAYHDLHGPAHTTSLLVMCMNDIKQADQRQMMLKSFRMTDADADRLFEVTEFTPGNMHSWYVRMRKFGDIWLPVEWLEGPIT